jgi:ABC-type transport system involved in cytochrome bd biosynthesis fused ATPase/permease subunit
MKDALIFNAIVLLVVLEADIGSHRKIGWFRILRPFVTSGVAVAIFIEAVTTTGTGLTLELALTAFGIVLGLAATALMGVYRSPKTHKAVSRAGFAYAALWVVVVGARAAFSFGSVHWFGHQLDHWMAVHAVTSAALTDALIFMAIAMVVTRSAGLALRARNLGPADAAEPSRQAAASTR